MNEPAGYVTRLYTECAVEAVDEVASLFQHETNQYPVVEMLASAESDPDKPPTFDQATVSVYLEPHKATESHQNILDLKLRLLAQVATIGTLQLNTIAYEDWAESWKKHYRPVRVGARLVVCPSWHDYHSSADELVLRLDPGMAFGTGVHPSTQMCLARMEHWVRKSDKALDVGTGSGILALGALGLGANRVVAIDVDPVAIDTARSNIERACLVKSAELVLGDINQIHWGQLPHDYQPPYDLVVANLTASIIMANLDNLMEPLISGGVMIASGIIVQREQEVSEVLSKTGITFCERHQQGDWLCLVVGKP